MSRIVFTRYLGYMQPSHPCRVMPTRHCPDVYEDVCGDRPCARFESEDEAPWLPEIQADVRRRIGLPDDPFEAIAQSF